MYAYMRKTCNPTYLESQKSRLERGNCEIWPIYGLARKISELYKCFLPILTPIFYR